MKNIFDTPDITSDFNNFIHTGGLFIQSPDELFVIQEDLLSDGLQLNGERRGVFTNLETEPDTQRGQDMKAILQKICFGVQKKVHDMTGKNFCLDEKLTAVWVETSTAPSNFMVHRDAEDPRIVRATFSVSPTRLLPSDVNISIDDDEWRKSRYPMGSTVLKGMEKQTISGDLGSTGIMGGTTYHRAPSPDEVLADFSSLFGASRVLERGKILRVFGSIWGKI